MTYELPPTLAWCEDDEDGIWMIDTRTNEITALKGAASHIWEATIGAVNTDAVIDRLVERHAWRRTDISDDVVATIDGLTRRGLVKEVSP